MLNCTASSLWQQVIMYVLGAPMNSPAKLGHYSGVFCGVLGAGEAICFGLDSIEIPYIKEVGGIFAFYATGVAVFYWLAWFPVDETN